MTRLESIALAVPSAAETVRHRVLSNAATLRVAQGLPFNGYIGTSIELRAGGVGPRTAWLALVETIPAGTEGTPLHRHLMRNVLQLTWNSGELLSKAERFFESRPMRIPEGANPQRLRVVGWVEDSRGRIVAAAQSRCRPG